MLSFGLLALACCAQEHGFFSILKDPSGYPEPRKTLQALARARGKKSVNHFCVVGIQDDQKHDDRAQVYWPEGNAMILWEAVADPKYPAPLTQSRRYLDLDKDVVKSEAELKGSTYLVTRAWVNQMKQDCAAHGDKFLIVVKRRK